MTVGHMMAPESGVSWQDAPLPLIFVAILASAMSAALALLLGWHLFLVASCQVRREAEHGIVCARWGQPGLCACNLIRGGGPAMH